MTASSQLPFFGTRLRRQNFNLAPTQYRQLRRLLYTLFRTKRSKSIPCPAAHRGREGVYPLGLKRFKKHQLPYFEMPWQINTIANRLFSHDVMAAIFIYKKMNRRPCLCTIPVGIELFSHVKTFFCSKQFAKLLTT